MIKFLKKTESFIKIILLNLIFLLPIGALAEIDDKKWSKVCNKKGSNDNCVITIKKNITDGQSTTLIQLSTASLMLTPNQAHPSLLVVSLPLGADLQMLPLIQIDETNIGNLTFVTCKTDSKCIANLGILNNGLELFKKGKILSVYFRSYGQLNNFIIEFPLKNFTKSYNSLIK